MPVCELMLETSTPNDTVDIGSRLGRLLLAGDIIALVGELGAGKTAFSQGLARGMGISAPVTSPTFTLINQYVSPDGRRLQHVDCYRLANAPFEMWDIGLGELMAGEDVVVIEWADRVTVLLPDDYLEVVMTYVDASHRRLCIRSRGVRSAALLGALAASLPRVPDPSR